MTLVAVVIAAGAIGLPPWHPVGAVTPPTPATKPVGTSIPCSTAVAPGSPLPGVETHFVSGLNSPFGVAFGSDSRHVFVDSAVEPGGAFNGGASVLGEYTVTSSGLVREHAGTFATDPLIGLAVSPDGRELVAASGSGASVFSVPRIEDPHTPPSSWLSGVLVSGGGGAIEAAVSPDGKAAFVTLEDSQEMAVFSLTRAERHGFGLSDLIGYLPLGRLPVGMAISSNGRYLYVTSEKSSATANEGVLTTIDIQRAENDPARSIVSTVWAGCDPVRVVASGPSVYVTARESDDVLRFSAAALTSHPSAALTSTIQVGEAPVGVALVDHDQMLVVADSNRFGFGSVSNLAVVSTTPTLKLLGYVPAGHFPRDMAVSPDGKTLIVSNYGSGQVEEVVVVTLAASLNGT